MGVPRAVTCLAVDGRSLRVLRAEDVGELRAEAIRAEQDGMEAAMVGEGPLGDPFVLVASLCEAVSSMLLGVHVVLGDGGRHPSLLAREATSLDLVCGGRTLLCFGPPFGDGLSEAIGLCRAMWRDGTATSEGPLYPVAGAVNRPLPARAGSPLLALDLTGPGARDEAGGAAALADMVVVAAGDEGGADGGGDGSGSVWRLERV
jgi:alkanesulfonate monooxygenase SsuD/methylene tetrahydromethanopterin reductase-like flavin-dependent oxidoreductase (luciferase family)